MTSERRSRPTIRCLTEDLGQDLPGLDEDLGQLIHPWMTELRRIAPSSPTGQKRVLSIDHPMVYRLRISSERGATWVDDDIVWLCAVRRREDGSDNDAFEWFQELHSDGRLLPSEEDRLRDQAEDVIRLFHRLREDLLAAVERALSENGVEHEAELDGWLPCRILVLHESGLEEIWCGLSVLTISGEFFRQEFRDLLFAALEEHLNPAIFEERNDWPNGETTWFETVRLGLR